MGLAMRARFCYMPEAVPVQPKTGANPTKTGRRANCERREHTGAPEARKLFLTAFLIQKPINHLLVHELYGSGVFPFTLLESFGVCGPTAGRIDQQCSRVVSPSQ